MAKQTVDEQVAAFESPQSGAAVLSGDEQSELTPLSADEDEVVLVIGDDDTEDADEVAEGHNPEHETPTFRKLRELIRAKDKELSQLRRAQPAAPQEKEPDDLGEIPTIEDCEFDPAVHAQKVRAWVEKAASHATAKSRKDAQDAEEKASWAKQLDDFHGAFADLGVQDHQGAVATVAKALPEARQAMLVEALGKDAAKLVYRLHKTPASLEKLASIKSNGKFIAQAAIMAQETKIERRKAAAPAPENKVSGGGVSAAQVGASNLERLREEARKTGDYTKVIAAKLSLKKAA